MGSAASALGLQAVVQTSSQAELTATFRSLLPDATQRIKVVLDTCTNEDKRRMPPQSQRSIILPGIKSRSSVSLEESPQQKAHKTPRTLKREMCEELLTLIETNGMALLERKVEDPGTWDATLLIGNKDDPSQFKLWLGDVDNALNFEALREHNVTAIVNMAVRDCYVEADFRNSVRDADPEDLEPWDKLWQGVKFNQKWYQERLPDQDFWYLPMDTDDNPGYPIHEKFDELVAFFTTCRKSNRNVLVHCKMGLNRAACAATVFIMREGLKVGETGLGLRDAVDYVSSRRAGVLQNDGFLCQLAIYGRPGEGQEYVVDLVESNS